ncbi:hypothetical protein [Aliivibrio wodanis]|uniref:hypothetical protein n=1 Tax=Aliivibrio wodanis TaxID=80852 RepID=UPI00406CC99E
MPLPVTHPDSPHHIALYAALLCSQNTLNKVKKAMMLILAEPETPQSAVELYSSTFRSMSARHDVSRG